MRAIMAAFHREAADDDQGPYAQRRGAGRADADGAVAHALRGPGQAGAAGAARGRGPRGGGDRRGVAAARQDRPVLAQALQRPRPRRSRGERAAGPPAGLLGGPGRGGDRGGADPAGRPRPAVRLVDARPPGRPPGRGERDRHAPQPRRRDPAARGAAVAPGGDLVRPAGRSGLRQKKGAIEQLYTDPPAGSVVVCLDETGPQASRSHPGRRPVRPDAAPAEGATQEIDYGRRGPAGYVFGAFRPAAGAALTATCERRTLGNWVDFLGKVEGWIDAGVERVYAVLDNLDVHTACDALLFSLAHPRWEFVFQPRYAAYLNLIEPWWKVLRSLALEGRRFEGWAEIEQAIERATAYWNEHRHPFVWGRRRRHRPRGAPASPPCQKQPLFSGCTIYCLFESGSACRPHLTTAARDEPRGCRREE